MVQKPGYRQPVAARAAMTKRLDRLPPLDLLVTFEAVARHLSITKAGAERFVTQSAISRQIKQLEDDLGTALFLRKHRALELTEDGRSLYETCTPLAVQLRSALAGIRKPRVRQTLSITTTPGFAMLWLIPRLGQFTREHPDIDVRLDSDVAWRDLAADDIDLAVRYGSVGAAYGRPLFRETVLPLCHPKLLDDAAHPLREPGDLQQQTLLQVAIPAGSTMPSEWGPWLQAMGLSGMRPAATLTFSNYDEAIAAALMGQGVALGRLPLVEHLMRTRKLVALFEGAIASQREYFVALNPAAKDNPAVQALERWLMDLALRHRQPGGCLADDFKPDPASRVARDGTEAAFCRRRAASAVGARARSIGVLAQVAPAKPAPAPARPRRKRRASGA